jgi:hypothetical protein
VRAAILLRLERTKAVKLSRKSSGRARAIAARDARHLIGVMGDGQDGTAFALRIPIKNEPELGPSADPVCEIGGI